MPATSLPIRRLTFIALGLALVVSPARAETLKVPSDAYPTIQSAVDAAQPGDVIQIGKGTYAEAVFVTDKTDLEIRGRGAILGSGLEQ